MSSFLSRLTRFKKATKGATAVEFSLVALPFFTFLFAIIEVGLIFASSLLLEHGTYEAARFIRTGQIQGGGVDELEEFEDILCDEVSLLLDCDTDLFIDVKPFDDFVSSSEPDPYDGGDLGSSFGFNTGTAGQVVLVRVFATWEIFTPLIGEFFANSDGNKRLISAYASFRNEPYNSTGGGWNGS